MRVLLAMMVAAVALAGCTTDSQNDDMEGASVTFDGSGDGNDTDTLECSEGAQLSGVGSVQQGQVMVFVVDGASNQAFAGTYDDQVDLEAEVVEGDGGQWSLEVERMAGFEGTYAFTLVCG